MTSLNSSSCSGGNSRFVFEPAKGTLAVSVVNAGLAEVRDPEVFRLSFSSACCSVIPAGVSQYAVENGSIGSCKSS